MLLNRYHSLALTKEGHVYVWGYNRDYELGLNDNMDRVLPQENPTLTNRKVAVISAGSYHNLAVTSDGSVFSWGLNNYGQLGRVAEKFGKFPAQVSIAAGGRKGAKKLGARKVAAGAWHSLAVVEDGEEKGQVFAWGRCHFGQVGATCDTRRPTSGSARQGSQQFPVKVAELEDKDIVDIAAGAAHSLAVAAV